MLADLDERVWEDEATGETGWTAEDRDLLLLCQDHNLVGATDEDECGDGGRGLERAKWWWLHTDKVCSFRLQSQYSRRKNH
jgi:hypothetical protein